MPLSRVLGKYYRMLAARSRAFDAVLVGVGALETQIESIVRKERPDLLLVIKGELFPANVASKLHRELGIKTALWFPDDPRYVKSLLMEKASAFELVAVSAKSTLQVLRLSGVNRVIHVPFACDPTIHRKIGMALTLNVTFVGSYYPERAKTLSALRRDVKIWGPYWNMPWVSREMRQQVMSDGSYGKRYI